MVKAQIIETIVEAAKENDLMTKSLLGQSIVEASMEVIDKDINAYEIKPILEAALYLCEQVEKCDVELNTNPGDRDIIRQKNKYLESLKKCLNQL
jgi:hypothetical protein